MLTERRSLAVFFILLVGITGLAFWPGLGGGFLFDDYPNILQQEQVHAESLDLESLQRAASAFNHGPVGRPLATITFAIDHAIGGKAPWGYKFSGLLVHLLNACLVLLLVRRLLALGEYTRKLSVAAAFVIALVWAVHPLQVSTVLYVVQRMETLSITFVLLGLLAYLKGRLLQIDGGRGWPWLLGVPVLMGIGLLSKETALLLPAYALGLELTVLRFGAANPVVARGLRVAYAAAVAVSLLAFFFLVVPHYADPAIYSIREFSLAERLMTQLRVLPMYLGWILLPQPSSFAFYYDNFEISANLLEPVTTLLGGLFLVGLAALAFATRRRLPLLSLGVFWFFASHGLTSNVVPLELVFEHRNYFSILAVLLALAELIVRLPPGRSRRTQSFILCLLVGGLVLITTIRSATWGDPMHLAMALAANNPGSARASTDLGEQFMILARNDASSRFYAMGVREFERGSRLPNSSPMPEQGLIAYSAAAGQAAKPEWWDRMAEKFRTRVIGPQEFSILTGLLELRRDGVLLDDQRFAEVYQIMCERALMPPSQYIAFGEHALYHLRDEDLASKLFIQGIARSGNDPELIAALVDSLHREGHAAPAARLVDYARALGILVELPGQEVPPAPSLPAGGGSL